MTTEKIIWLSQRAYGICIIAMGIQQLGYGQISDNFFPSAFSTNPIYQVFSYPWGVAFVLSGVAMLVDKKAFKVSLISAGIFLTLFFVGQVPYMLLVSAHGNSLLYWAPAFESLAFTGASLVFAGSCRDITNPSSVVLTFLNKLIPYAGVFFFLHANRIWS